MLSRMALHFMYVTLSIRADIRREERMRSDMSRWRNEDGEE
jgi:hypothetical protein